MTIVESLRLVFLILGAVYGIGALVHRAYIWRKVKNVDDRVCQIKDQVEQTSSLDGQPQRQAGFKPVNREEASNNEEVPFPGGQEPHDVNTWVSQLEGREL